MELSYRDFVPIHVGLAGHIDHGKTALAAQLTEKVSTAGLDKHPQAQERGISIDIGFTSFHLGDFLVTLVDVPGHADFIRSVVAGADIIDAAILVVAADEGPGVQTGEHILILEYFGIDNVIVALNKIDLVDSNKIDKVTMQIRNVLKDTGFKDAPIIPVSAKTGYGITDLKQELLEQLTTPTRQTKGPFKMPIDHAFPIRGVGTVTTGTIHRGTVEVGNEVMIEPIGSKVRIKNIQTFGEDREHAQAGDRVGIAISEIDPNLIYRGCVACETDSLMVTDRFNAGISISKHYKDFLSPQMTVHVSAGMPVVAGKIIPYQIMNGKKIVIWKARAGETCNAFFKLQKPVAVEEGDKILVSRLDLPPKTLRIAASGEIIDVSPEEPEFYREQVKTGKVTSPNHLNTGKSVVDFLARRKKGAERLVGEQVETENGVRGKIVDSFGTRGAVLVKFEGLPKKNDRVLLRQIRRYGT